MRREDIHDALSRSYDYGNFLSSYPTIVAVEGVQQAQVERILTIIASGKNKHLNVCWWNFIQGMPENLYGLNNEDCKGFYSFPFVVQDSSCFLGKDLSLYFPGRLVIANRRGKRGQIILWRDGQVAAGKCGYRMYVDCNIINHDIQRRYEYKYTVMVDSAVMFQGQTIDIVDAKCVHSDCFEQFSMYATSLHTYYDLPDFYKSNTL